MKLILTKSSLVFDRGATQISQKYGNEIQGMTLRTYFNGNGGEQYSGSSAAALSPFINIDGLLSDITISKSFAAYTDPPVDVVFYSSADASAVVGVHTESNGGRYNPTIAKASVPATAKFMRICCASGSTTSSTSSDATEVTFTKGN